MGMNLFYSDPFELPLPAGHRFPISKYRLLRERLRESSYHDRLEFRLSDAVTNEQLLLVHSADYLERLTRGELSSTEQKRIGFPWSPQMVERSRRSTGGTVGAARKALVEGAAAHLAGGTHHAFPDHGQGFCVFNDVAVAIRVLQSERLCQRALVIDLDVHQGNGTAFIFAEDPDVFTFSMHGESNFPFSKCAGDLDIALPDRTGDKSYLEHLAMALGQLPLEEVDIAFYLAGADPFLGDRLGKLHLSKAGLAERDAMVINACFSHEVPLALVMAGGYAKSIDDVVTIHVATIEALLHKCGERTSGGQ